MFVIQSANHLLFLKPLRPANLLLNSIPQPVDIPPCWPKPKPQRDAQRHLIWAPTKGILMATMSSQYDSMGQWTLTRQSRFVTPNIIYFSSCLTTFQGELEHRLPKSRYTRTNRKCFMKQLTRIERRQARIRTIRAQQNQAGIPPN